MKNVIPGILLYILILPVSLIAQNCEPILPKEGFGSIKLGQTTMKELISILGKPDEEAFESIHDLFKDGAYSHYTPILIYKKLGLQFRFRTHTGIPDGGKEQSIVSQIEFQKKYCGSLAGKLKTGKSKGEDIIRALGSPEIISQNLYHKFLELTYPDLGLQIGLKVPLKFLEKADLEKTDFSPDDKYIQSGKLVFIKLFDSH
ncbi:MAG: hypothetical protein MRZ79_06265 [Bacteroidia bacterium]|nr:hypothetical protein [Bacteroidia bacterium]